MLLFLRCDANPEERRMSVHYSSLNFLPDSEVSRLIILQLSLLQALTPGAENRH